MIYFDKNKKAYSFEIANPICTILNELWDEYSGTDKWDIIDGKFIDISQTEDYLNKQNEILKFQLENEIKEFDFKRIRAICEPGTRDDGQSWLEYYTSQIQQKREQMNNL